MTTFQISMLVAAGLVGLSIFWEDIKAAFAGFKSSKVKPFMPAVEGTAKDSSLVEIIRCWEHLKVSCQKANLENACEELDKIFPLFVPKASNREVENV